MQSENDPKHPENIPKIFQNVPNTGLEIRRLVRRVSGVLRREIVIKSIGIEIVINSIDFEIEGKSIAIDIEND